MFKKGINIHVHDVVTCIIQRAHTMLCIAFLDDMFHICYILIKRLINLIFHKVHNFKEDTKLKVHVVKN